MLNISNTSKNLFIWVKERTVFLNMMSAVYPQEVLSFSRFYSGAHNIFFHIYSFIVVATKKVSSDV